MTKSKTIYIVAAILAMVCGLLIVVGIFGPGLYRILRGSTGSTPDFEATLQVLVAEATASSSAPPPTQAATATSDEPSGKIVFTCQDQSGEHICLINADGSNWRRLTPNDGFRRFYASLAPDGESVVYSQYREPNVYEIYELTLASSAARRLTDRLGTLNAPEISPDGKSIVFMRWTPASNQSQIWVMDRDGGNPRRVFAGSGWDPTWSPDGTRILFASDRDGAIQLYDGDLGGTDVQRITNLPEMRGRSDWSVDDLIATYSGGSWKREVYVMNTDGSDVHQVSPPGGSSQGPSFSPDGKWIAFTSYLDKYGDDNGCEIYIIRTDGTDLRRLTNNEYCDYQPRWGP